MKTLKKNVLTFYHSTSSVSALSKKSLTESVAVANASVRLWNRPAFGY